MRNYNNYDPIREGFDKVQEAYSGDKQVKPSNPFGTQNEEQKANSIALTQQYAMQSHPQDPAAEANLGGGQQEVSQLMDESQDPMVEKKDVMLNRDDERKRLVNDLQMQEDAAPFQTQYQGAYYGGY